MAIKIGSTTRIDNNGAATFTTVNTGQGANELYDMNQNVKTDSAVTFATVNTGQGANELYDMNQNVKTTNNVTFSSVATTSINNDSALWRLGEYQWGGNTHTSLGLKGQTPSIELEGVDGTPYIDFTIGNATSNADYDMRIINTSNDVLEIKGGNLKVNGKLQVTAVVTENQSCTLAEWGSIATCIWSGNGGINSICICRGNSVNNIMRWHITS